MNNLMLAGPKSAQGGYRPAGSLVEIDRGLSVLEIMTADVSGRLVRSRVKQFRTLRAIDVEEVCRVTDNSRT